MADTYKRGDIVTITITGARVDEWRPEVSELTVDTSADANSDLTTFDLASAQVTVERADPEWWPPRPADVLRHTPTGRLWFGVAHASNLCLYSSNGDCMDPQQTWEQRHRLEIVHREEESRG